MVYHRQALDRVFAALADPTRRAILARLARGETAISHLARPFSMSLPAVSKHLRVLERAGLAVTRRDGRVRPCGLVAEPLRGAADWVEEYRKFWDRQLDQLASYLGETTEEKEPTVWQPPRPTRKPTSSRSAGPSRPHRSGSSKPGPRRRS